MRTIMILATTALLAGFVMAQPFGPNEGRGPVATAERVEAHVQVRGDGDCVGAKTMTRTGRGEGGQAMLQRQLKAADGQHATGPVGAQRRAGNR